jgi:hypothetical protein
MDILGSEPDDGVNPLVYARRDRGGETSVK